MKHKPVCVLLAAEAVVCIAVCLLSLRFESAFSSVLAFPFEQLGLGLRALSLPGGFGNIAANLLYCCVCLLPAAYLAGRVHGGRAHAEDALLALLSAVLFAVLYLMINPAGIGSLFGSFEMIDMGKAVLGGTVYSVLVGYIILRAIRAFSSSEAESLLRYLYILMAAICMVLVYGIFGSGLAEWIDRIRQFMQDNNAGGRYINVSYVFLALQYLVSVLPYALEIAILFAGFGLVQALDREPYSQEVVCAAQRMGRMCRIAVVAIMLFQIAVNMAQLMLGSLVRSSHYTVSVPLLSIAFVLVALLLSKYVAQGKKLKDDNELFI